MRVFRTILLSVALAMTVVGGAALLAPRSAHAVIGRPLTPVSYAGVARRTVRRSVRRW